MRIRAGVEARPVRLVERRNDYLWLAVWERNVAARLPGPAGAGELLISEETRLAAGPDASGMEPRRLSLKGRERPLYRCLGDHGSVTAVASRAGVHEPERTLANLGKRWKV